MIALNNYMKRFVWTHARDVELAQRYIAGEAFDEIAAILGCTTQALRTRCNTLGIVRRKVRANRPEHGNAAFLLAGRFREAIPVDDDAFASDLLAMLDWALDASD